jgi:DUF4097 and DUF4098 domain-containing protein YvlB
MTQRLLVTLLVLVAANAAAAERNEVIDRSFPATAGKVVLIDAGALDISVRSAEISEIRLHVELAAGAFKDTQATAWIDAHRPTIEDGDSQLKVVAPDPGGIDLFKGVVITRARVELVLPPAVKPDLSTSSGSIRVEGEFPGGEPLRLRSASGDIDLNGWAPDMEVRSTSGDLQLRVARAVDHLLGRSASGSIFFAGGARNARCDTASGDIHLDGLLGPTEIATTSGNISASFDALPADSAVTVTSSSGRVRLTLPPGTKPQGTLATTRGEIRSSFTGTTGPEEQKLTFTGDGPKVDVTTTSGMIQVY